MNLDFIRFKASDAVELCGWLSNVAGDSVVLHIHGKSGNGYENYFLDYLRESYTRNGISFFSINTRGAGIITDFRHGDATKHAGSCFELFDESVHDIQGAIDYLKSIGKSSVILEGHSLGCAKVVNYDLESKDSVVTKVILLAPTDLAGWAASHPEHLTYIKNAQTAIEQGNPEELVGAQCWLDLEPISAQTYLNAYVRGTNADIYGSRTDGSMLSKVGKPMLIVYGTEDIGIKKIDGTLENWLRRVKRILNKHTSVATIKGAPHSYRNYEKELVKIIEEFIK